MHSKSTILQSCPPVLTLHLKRFRVTPNQIFKMNNLITYPLYDLDLSEQVAIQEPGQCYQYDLFGQVHHFGTLNQGHYTATIKNDRTGEWLYYDDSSVRVQNESEVLSKSAYILFYVRKDIKAKGMSQVIPRLNKSHFAGMPVHLRTGHVGYLLEYRAGNPCPYVVGLGNGIVMYLSKQAILADPDSEDLSATISQFKRKRGSEKDRGKQDADDKKRT